MKLLLAFAAVVAVAYGATVQDADTAAAAQDTAAAEKAPAIALNLEGQPPQTSEKMVRDLPADVLRDFTGLCFASTLCRVFEINQSWGLEPFCGTAQCILSPEGYLIERVHDCGVIPKPNSRCQLVNEADKEKPFPDCCPVFKCEEGVQLEFPTPEELQASVQGHEHNHAIDQSGSPVQAAPADAPTETTTQQ